MQQRLSRKAVIVRIKELHAAGEKLNSRVMIQKHNAFFLAAQKVFGSWEKAVRAAGFDYSKIKVRPGSTSPWTVEHIAPKSWERFVPTVPRSRR